MRISNIAPELVGWGFSAHLSATLFPKGIQGRVGLGEYGWGGVKHGQGGDGTWYYSVD